MEAAGAEGRCQPFDWTEITYLEQQAGSTAILVFLLGTVLVFLVLAAKYESRGRCRWPSSWSCRCACCAAVTGMLIVRMPVDIFVQIGFLVLAGLAAKNAILIVEFARQLQQEGRTLPQATIDASRLRLRPIVMTSFAFIAA